MARVEVVPVQRAELVTQDMELLEDLVRQLYGDHVGRFRCDDPARIDGQIRSVTAGELGAGQLRYGGVSYQAEVDPVAMPIAMAVTQGCGRIGTARDEVSFGRGGAFLISPDRPMTSAFDDAEYAALQVPQAVVSELARERTGMPPGRLRFEGMAPISAEAERMFARTAEFICGQLVPSETTQVSALVVQEMTRLAAAVMLETFPNTTMTVPYLRGPGWVAPAAVRRAAAFIEAHADQPLTMDQIAAAAGVTGRALQYAFRRTFNLTPTGYLRRIRLDRARKELHAADPAAGVTVAEVARRWGWASQAQFAQAYRQRFEETPAAALRA
jgi:AraC-like DNA-binding protein